ncbi:hypothetical protein CWN57_30045, partial [Klebsiella pneumoniae]
VFHRIRWAVRYAALSVWGAGINHKYANLRPFFLICQQFGKVRLCSIGNTDHSVGLIVDYFTGL